MNRGNLLSSEFVAFRALSGRPWAAPTESMLKSRVLYRRANIARMLYADAGISEGISVPCCNNYINLLLFLHRLHLLLHACEKKAFYYGG